MDIAVLQKDAILLFDEQDRFVARASVALHGGGYRRVFGICDASRLDSFIASHPVALVVFGLYAPLERSLNVLKGVLRDHPGTNVIVVSALDDRESAVDCIKLGAADYLLQPLDTARLIDSVGNCMEKLYRQENLSPVQRPPLSGNPVFAPIVTRDRKMLTIFRYMDAIAPTSQAVMITGETGTGKELVARALHHASGRSGNFVTVNVAGLDDIMFSDTLFGHERGAYTGAERARKGLIEKAAGGTLFLDEIGDLSNASQVKLLRLLQEGEYYSLGSDSIVYSNARVIVATNCNLDKKLDSGGFRQDLYYRLCSHHIHLPPLRERKSDIPLLIHHFVQDAAEELGRPVPAVSADTVDQLVRYDYPGNIRELKGLISNSVALSSSGVLTVGRLSGPGLKRPDARPAADFGLLPVSAGRMPTLEEAEDFLIREALRVSGGNQRAAAVMLGISRQALSKRLQRNPSYLAAT